MSQMLRVEWALFFFKEGACVHMHVCVCMCKYMGACTDNLKYHVCATSVPFTAQSGSYEKSIEGIYCIIEGCYLPDSYCILTFNVRTSPVLQQQETDQGGEPAFYVGIDFQKQDVMEARTVSLDHPDNYFKEASISKETIMNKPTASHTT